jgi:hypothetical protein
MSPVNSGSTSAVDPSPRWIGWRVMSIGPSLMASSIAPFVDRGTRVDAGPLAGGR